MKVYVAGPWSKKALMHGAHAYVRKAGLRTVSTWTTEPDSEYDSDVTDEHAQRDVRELQSADALIIFNFAGVKSEGKATELGMALAWGKRVILVGERKGNTFYKLPQVEQVDTLAEAITRLL